MGNVSINLSLANIWTCWYLFRAGKRNSSNIDEFNYFLEKNLFKLHEDLNNGNYRHGRYKEFTVTDSKKRKISVASIRDRVVHRILYEYLVPIYDKTFDHDIWSCRKGKGLFSAIERTQFLLRKYRKCFVWRADIKKFFDNVDHPALKNILKRKIKSADAIRLLDKIIDSYSEKRKVCGISIGNLTSQIFANIYLNEFDRFVRNILKPIAYLRYGDDFIIIEKNKIKISAYREKSIKFLINHLKLCINEGNEVIIKTKRGLKFLGMRIYPAGRKLNSRNIAKIDNELSLKISPATRGW